MPAAPRAGDDGRDTRAARVRLCQSSWTLRAVIAAACLWLLAPVAQPADGARHVLWAVQGRHNIVYLLGSVHALKPGDALPAEALAAYARAQTLVMEVALDSEALQFSLQVSMLSYGLLPEGQTLQGVLGDRLYARLRSQATALGVSPELLDPVRPWLAALTLQQAKLAQSGYDPEAGVDLQLAARAQADRKPIIGLETLQEQLGFFAHLSASQQRQFLEQTLDELEQGDAEIEEVVTAWNRGDTRHLEELLDKSRRESPELFQLLTTDRNRRWLPKIEGLLGRDQDCLVVVGALHLVGREGLVALLERRGYHAVQQ